MKCALLTSSDYPDLILDDQLLMKEMVHLGWKPEPVIWDSENISWNDYRFALVRTTWDYSYKITKFLNTLSKIEKTKCKLINSYEIIKWNSNKKYLFDLNDKGIRIIPTIIVDKLNKTSWISQLTDLGWEDFILKPTISANAYNTFKISLNRLDQIEKSLVSSKDVYEWLAQPFIKSIAEEGEYSFIFFNNKYSFAILKTPKSGDFRVQEKHGGMNKLVTPQTKDLDAAKDVIQKLNMNFTYARIDMVRLQDGNLAVMEIEAIEPQLYYHFHPESMKTFISAIQTFVLKT